MLKKTCIIDYFTFDEQKMAQIGIPESNTLEHFSYQPTTGVPWTGIWVYTCGGDSGCLRLVPDLNIHLVFDLSGSLDLEPFLLDPGFRGHRMNTNCDTVLFGLEIPAWGAQELKHQDPRIGQDPKNQVQSQSWVEISHEWVFFLYFELLDYYNSIQDSTNHKLDQLIGAFASLVRDSMRRFRDPNIICYEDASVPHRYYSQRHKRRLFRATLGLSPKQVERITRFQSLLAGMISNGSADYRDYYDQSHGIQEFKFFTGLRPQEFLETYLTRPNNMKT